MTTASRPMKGLWRNRLGAELHVIEPAVYVLRTFGVDALSDDIWHAERRDALFGTKHYMVTVESLASAGYERADGEEATP